MHTIAIIGGGFSGTSLATRLLQDPPARPTRILLIERRAQVGRGVAYSTRAYPYVLNAPASGMSADPAKPDDFLRYARTRDAGAQAGDFLPRGLYGDYLIARLEAAVRAAPAHVVLETVHAEVTAVRRADGGGWRIEMAPARSVAADEVVLATGNPRPASLAIGRGLDRINDLWDEAGVVPGEHPVLIIGTALTMADMVTRLAAHSTRAAPIIAVSRHGLLPQPHDTAHGAPFAGDVAALQRAAGTSMRTLLRAVRAMAKDAAAHGSDWRAVITFIRPHAPALWAALAGAERARFLRHVRVYWDLHRHRVAPAMAQRMAALRAAGLLEICAARIVALESWGDRIRATLLPRGGGEARALVVDYVINCTGPDYRIATSRDPLLRQLLGERLIAPDALGLGLRTGPAGEALDPSGAPVPGLSYVGPLLRASWWEATAVPELRGHVEHLAGALRGRVSEAP
ncbi:MAG: FAD/NAD(P)-binding protein [Steroidobacteraceae bacterium]|nr:FAD/NAD(P)-binding protein [Steroidobacteraceae bacterium]